MSQVQLSKLVKYSYVDDDRWQYNSEWPMTCYRGALTIREHLSADSHLRSHSISSCQYFNIQITNFFWTHIYNCFGDSGWTAYLESIFFLKPGLRADTIATLTCSLNEVLNALFDLNQKEMSIFTLNPLNPAKYQILTLVVELKHAIPVPKQIDSTCGEVSDTVLYRELSSDRYLFMIDLASIPTNFKSIFLLDYLLIETFLDYADLSNIVQFELNFWTNVANLNFHPKLGKAVKLGSACKRNIYCVPLIDHPQFDIECKQDFVGYYKHVKKCLAKSEKERIFTEFPDCETELKIVAIGVTSDLSPSDCGVSLSNLYILHHL